jgi:hypothetical protein
MPDFGHELGMERKPTKENRLEYGQAPYLLEAF